MNAVTLLRRTETIGARDFRRQLDRILRKPSRTWRVMLHNRPALAVLPDHEYLQLLEILEELRTNGLLERVTKKLAKEHKRGHAWFWSRSWQRKEREADKEVTARKIRRARSADQLIRHLKA